MPPTSSRGGSSSRPCSPTSAIRRSSRSPSRRVSHRCRARPPAVPQLYAQADTALHAAKRAGRTEVLVFEPGTEIGATAAGASAAIAEVIEQNLLRPVFQPIVDLGSGGTLGYEGLIRPVPPAPYADPASLFAAAEASGHVVALDLACVEAIVAAAARMPKELFLSVNMSPRTIEAPEFSAPIMLNILARHDFPPERLVIELTEHQPIADLERVRKKFDTCRSAGHPPGRR